MLLLAAILSFCSIAYELLFANVLALFSGGVIWWHSLTIGIYIAGIGVGTFQAGHKLFPEKNLFKIELILSAIGMSSIALIYFLIAFYETANSVAQVGHALDYGAYMRLHTALKALFFLSVESIVFFIGFLSGHEIPFLIRISGESTGSNRILAASYAGTLLGTLFFAYLFMPYLDMVYTAYTVGAINLLACIWLGRNVLSQGIKKNKLVILFISFWWIFLCAIGGTLEQHFLQIYYRVGTTFADGKRKDLISLWSSATDDGRVERIKSHYQYIDYFHATLNNKREFILMLDTNFQLSTRNEKSYHEAFAHIPILAMNEIPKKILILGAGDGLLARELLKYPEIEFLKQVELDAEMIKLARNNPTIARMNRGSLKNPRLNLVIEDAFQYLRQNEEKFDAIFIDFPYPKNFNLAKLFSIEFYGFVKRALKDDGFMVLDAPLRPQSSTRSYGRWQGIQNSFLTKDKTTNSIIMSTIYEAGFSTLMPYIVENETFIIATNNTNGIKYDLSGANSIHFEKLDKSVLDQIGEQFFPFELEAGFVNSIFHPRLIQ